MKIVGKFDIIATVEITGEEAEMLEHLTSWDLTEWFYEHANRGRSKDKIKESLHKLREQLFKIGQAVTKANQLQTELSQLRQ